jgi:hypothetical protein
MGVQGFSPGDWEGSVINTASLRDVYPGAQMYDSTQQAGTGDDYANMSSDNWGAVGAGGVGADGGGQNPDMSGGGMGTGGMARGSKAPGGLIASPLTWVVVLAVFAVGIMFTAHKTGRSEEFASIRASAYNIFFVTLTAMVGILILKGILGRVKVPGLSTAVMAV